MSCWCSIVFKMARIYIRFLQETIYVYIYIFIRLFFTRISNSIYSYNSVEDDYFQYNLTSIIYLNRVYIFQLFFHCKFFHVIRHFIFINFIQEEEATSINFSSSEINFATNKSSSKSIVSPLFLLVTTRVTWSCYVSSGKRE